MLYSFGALGGLLDCVAWLGAMCVVARRSQPWMYFECFVLVATILSVAADAAFDLRRVAKVSAVITLGLRQVCIRVMFLIRAQAWMSLAISFMYYAWTILVVGNGLLTMLGAPGGELYTCRLCLNFRLKMQR